MRIGMGSVHHGLGVTAADCAAIGQTLQIINGVYSCRAPLPAPYQDPAGTCIPTDAAGNLHCQYQIPNEPLIAGVPVCVGSFGAPGQCYVPPVPVTPPPAPVPVVTQPPASTPPPSTTPPTSTTPPPPSSQTPPPAAAPTTIFGMAIPSVLTEHAIDGIPNWVFIVGIGFVMLGVLGRRR